MIYKLFLPQSIAKVASGRYKEEKSTKKKRTERSQEHKKERAETREEQKWKKGQKTDR